MTDQVVRLVLLPRYTAVYGGTPLYMAPFNVRKFAKLVLAGWTGRGVGSSAPSVTITLEQSADLGLWHSAGSLTPTAGAGAGATTTFDLLDLEWARVKVEVQPASGQPPGTTVWAVGAFVLREGAQS